MTHSQKRSTLRGCHMTCRRSVYLPRSTQSYSPWQPIKTGRCMNSKLIKQRARKPMMRFLQHGNNPRIGLESGDTVDSLWRATDSVVIWSNVSSRKFIRWRAHWNSASLSASGPCRLVPSALTLQGLLVFSILSHITSPSGEQQRQHKPAAKVIGQNIRLSNTAKPALARYAWFKHLLKSTCSILKASF